MLFQRLKISPPKRLTEWTHKANLTERSFRQESNTRLQNTSQRCNTFCYRLIVSVFIHMPTGHSASLLLIFSFLLTSPSSHGRRVGVAKRIELYKVYYNQVQVPATTALKVYSGNKRVHIVRSNMARATLNVVDADTLKPFFFV